MDNKEDDFTLDDIRSGVSKATKSAKSKTKSSGSKHQSRQIDSDEISFSQLELMANRKKLTKKGEISVSDLLSKKAESQKSNKSEGDKPAKHDSSSSSISSMTSDSKSEERQKRKARTVNRENRNDAVRKEKSELLYKFNKMNVKQKWSSLRLDMNCSLDEIKNECERVRNEIQSERSTAFYKRMLLLGVQGIEMMNSKFDPLGVDLDGWSEAMGYSLENQDYDEVMAELAEKYKGAGNMSPELKLVFMIISSATMFTVSKKISKMDSSNAFTNIIGSIIGNQQQPSQQPQQMYQQPPQQPQQMYQQPQQMYYEQAHEYGIPSASDLRRQAKEHMTETTDDPMPSKLRGPSTAIAADKIDINNILKTMNARKEEKVKEMHKEESDDVFKSIPLNTGKRGRGRPKKGVVTRGG